jgi:hypothetical protein
LIKHLEQNLGGSWIRDQEKEDWVKEGIPAERPYCFFLRDNSHYPPAFVWLVENEKMPGVLYVPNIIPAKKSSLSRAEYNAVLSFFFESVVKPAVEATGDRAEFSAPTASLEQMIDEPVAEKLRYFSGTASRRTAAAHPTDQQKWLEFLIESHRRHSRLGTDFLRRWLADDEKWPPETANELVGEYEFARSLLDFYDKAKG